MEWVRLFPSISQEGKILQQSQGINRKCGGEKENKAKEKLILNFLPPRSPVKRKGTAIKKALIKSGNILLPRRGDLFRVSLTLTAAGV
jgi:hypothetical protein